MKREAIEIEFSVLENGFDFIHEAAEELVALQSNELDLKVLKRKLKYTVLHLSSGIELVFKHRLLKSHWTYVFQDMNKADDIALNKGDIKSVDSSTAIERLKKLCKIELTQNERGDHERLREIRNRIEHYNCKVNVLAVENILHANITMIIKFICNHINQASFTEDEAVILQNIKRTLAQLDEHYEEAKKLAMAEMTSANVDLVYDCPECGEHFFTKMHDGKAHCFFCEHDLSEYETARFLADNYIFDVMNITQRDIQKGAEYPLYSCPDCGMDTFVMDYDNDLCKCFYCDVDYSNSEIIFCSECGEPIIFSEDEGVICDDCLANIMGKD